MAYTPLTVQTIARTGTVVTLAAANAGGNTFANDGNTYLHVKNGAGSPINVTIDVPGTVDDLAVTDRVVAVANGTEKVIGPFPPGLYNTLGDVYVTYSAVTTITVGAFRM